MAEMDSRQANDFAAMTEAELVTQARQGRREAFRAIMQGNNQRLFRVARGIVTDDSEAEDVVQESYLRAFAALESFRGESSLLTWLTRITINEARGRLRRRRPMVDLDAIEAAQSAEGLVVAFPNGQPMENPEAALARVQIRLLIEQAIDTLPEAFRLVFILREVQDCSVQETAELLGIKEETVKTRHHRARRQLRAALDESLANAMQGTFPFLGSRCERITATVLDRLYPYAG
ncbi:MAG: RNA polymerase sigma factor [Proteobacteria bacterium]|nr:RNA polymerase sigma factor [Pseudomonadota bacterium]